MLCTKLFKTHHVFAHRREGPPRQIWPPESDSDFVRDVSTKKTDWRVLTKRSAIKSSKTHHNFTLLTQKQQKLNLFHYFWKECASGLGP